MAETRAVRRASLLLLVALAAVPAVSAWIGQPYYVSLFARILILALAASGLNLLLGYAGLVSFGHALYIGIGAYSVAILSFYGISAAAAHFAAAVLASALVSLLLGAVCLRTRGMAFIMITLAFAQMAYVVAVGLRAFGGDDGLALVGRSDFGVAWLRSNYGLYYVAFAVLVLAWVLSRRMADSRFGMVLRGSKSNPDRMATLGFPTLRYQLVAYVVSAVLCALAGALLANLTRFASPSYMQWQASGDLIVMVVLGGIGTPLGPLVGALVVVLLEEVLSSWTQHWTIVLGPLIVLAALTAKRGLVGGLGTAREPKP
jgi:branched-chain amino acid transport system permease protein